MVRTPLGMNLNGAGAVITTLQMLKQGYGENVRYIVGVGAHYGAYVEFGTSRMAAQPYLFPAARQVMRSEFSKIEKEAHVTMNPTEHVVRRTALAIEREAKKKAPVDTGFLRSSIEAAPAGEFM